MTDVDLPFGPEEGNIDAVTVSPAGPVGGDGTECFNPDRSYILAVSKIGFSAEKTFLL
jgi:hypothetical protein